MSALGEEFARQTLEHLRQRFVVERERAALARPRQLVASGHRRHPDLTDGGVGAHDEPRLGRLVEQQVERAVRELDLEAFPVGEWQQRTPRFLQRLVALDAEFLVRELSRHWADLSDAAT